MATKPSTGRSAKTSKPDEAVSDLPGDEIETSNGTGEAAQASPAAKDGDGKLNLAALKEMSISELTHIGREKKII